jgi:molybdenum cofactor cytidylyltransferase
LFAALQKPLSNQYIVSMIENISQGAVLVLAAGAASRFGSAKQLFNWQGKTLVEHAVTQALSLSDEVWVVTGAYQHEIEVTLAPYAVKTLWNPNWASGMGTSIAAGATALLSNKPLLPWLLVILVDQPFIPLEKLQLLVQTFQLQQKPVVAAYYQGRGGVPAVFGSSCFEKLTLLQGDQGARAVIRNASKEDICFVEIPEAANDIDHQEDAQRWSSA